MSQSNLAESGFAQVKTRIETMTGLPVKDLRPFASGNNAALYIADLAGGTRYVAKSATRFDARLPLEAFMLSYLGERSHLPVPKVHGVNDDILLLDYIAHASPITNEAQEDAARHLAQLHQIRGVHYGFERQTQIGTLEQDNRECDDWLTFFRDRRLMPMAWLAHQENAINDEKLAAIEKLAGQLDLYITNPAPPALIHGDIWAGNVLTLGEKVAAFVDPAIYYADPEIELAFASLFGNFNDRFFRAYAEINPMRAGFFEVRRHLYNLYPLLVHARMFGAPYPEAIAETLKRFI